MSNIKLRTKIERLSGKKLGVLTITKLLRTITELDEYLHRRKLDSYLGRDWIKDTELIDELEYEDFSLRSNPFFEPNDGLGVLDLFKVFKDCEDYFNIEIDSGSIDDGITDFLLRMTIEDKIEKIDSYFVLKYSYNLNDILGQNIIVRDDVRLSDITTLGDIFDYRKNILVRHLLWKNAEELVNERI
ncbi:hypothetical protein EQ500_01650 [Lactobacillus sp. XV13L]|nr:hypothetical protein [Lactobacillus sp. XV13L]